MADIKRSRRELESKILSEYSAIRLEYDNLMSKVKILLLLSISFGAISIFSIMTFYSPRLVGAIIAVAASMVGIIFTTQIYQIISRDTRYMRHSLNELTHEIIRMEYEDDLRYRSLDEQFRGQAYVQTELCWGLYLFHLFFILTAVLKYFGLWAVGA
jgi:hypothetical protein